jgi:hypothetical protein
MAWAGTLFIPWFRLLEGHMTFDGWTPALERLVAFGRERGYVTHGKLNAALPCDEVSSEMIEAVLAMLSDYGIDVVEGGGAADDETAIGGPRKPLSPLPLQSGAEAPLDQGCFGDAASRTR